MMKVGTHTHTHTNTHTHTHRAKKLVTDQETARSSSTDASTNYA